MPTCKERLTVLVVEDDPNQRWCLTTELRDDELDVVEAGDSETALSLFQDLRWVDVLLTDVRLPGAIDGLELAARLVSGGRCGAVIYATGYRYDPPRMVSPSLIFRKPYSIAAVVTAVRDMAELARLGRGASSHLGVRGEPALLGLP